MILLEEGVERLILVEKSFQSENLASGFVAAVDLNAVVFDSSANSMVQSKYFPNGSEMVR